MEMKEKESKSEAEELESLKSLKQWLQKQPHLPKDFDDSLLLAFVKQTNSLEIAKKKIDAFCTFRTKSPEFFQFPECDILDPAFRDACKFTNIFMLPNPTPEGYRVIMIKGCNPEKFKHNLVNVRVLMMLQAALEMWPDVKGIIGIMDVMESNSEVLPKLEIPATLKGFKYVQEGMPMKTKKLIILNVNQVTEFVINNMVKPIFKSKIMDRLVISNEDVKFLEKYLPLEMLPIDLGGKAPSIKELNDEWLNILEKRRDRTLKYSKFCSDESKRPSESNDIANMDGSFRYLNID